MPRTGSKPKTTTEVAARLWRESRANVATRKANLVAAIVTEVEVRGLSVSEVARQLDLDRTLVHAWLREYRAQGHTEDVA